MFNDNGHSPIVSIKLPEKTESLYVMDSTSKSTFQTNIDENLNSKGNRSSRKVKRVVLNKFRSNDIK